MRYFCCTIAGWVCMARGTGCEPWREVFATGFRLVGRVTRGLGEAREVWFCCVGSGSGGDAFVGGEGAVGGVGRFAGEEEGCHGGGVACMGDLGSVLLWVFCSVMCVDLRDIWCSA